MSTDQLAFDDHVAVGGAVRLVDLMGIINGLDANGSDGDLVDQITVLERVKSACAAAQARLTRSFTVSQQADAAARKVHPDRTRRSIAAQVGLARRDSRFRGQQHVGLAQALVEDLPHTLAALSRGDLSEFRARTIIEQLACLTPADRTRADSMIAAELPELGDRTAETRAAAIAYRLDPEAVMSKIRGAVKDRHVGVRPAPDTMSRLSALLPVAHGVAVYAALSKSADNYRANGDDRNRGQIMADELVSRITGQAITGCDDYGIPATGGPGQTAGAGNEDPTPTTAAEHHNGADQDATHDTDIDAGDGAVEGAAAVKPDRRPDRNAVSQASCTRCAALQLNLIMTDRTLFTGGDEPAHLIGHGPIPAPLARALVIGHADAATTTWVRRLYTDPSGQLVAMDSRQRLFPAGAQRFLIARDQTCRTPWCDAPIRHIDHVAPHSQGGRTSIDNGQGLCEACNLSKQAPEWRSQAGRNGVIETTTPTGHTYPSHPPPPPTSGPWPDISSVELHLTLSILDAA